MPPQTRSQQRIAERARIEQEYHNSNNAEAAERRCAISPTITEDNGEPAITNLQPSAPAIQSRESRASARRRSLERFLGRNHPWVEQILIAERLIDRPFPPRRPYAARLPPALPVPREPREHRGQRWDHDEEARRRRIVDADNTNDALNRRTGTLRYRNTAATSGFRSSEGLSGLAATAEQNDRPDLRSIDGTAAAIRRGRRRPRGGFVAEEEEELLPSYGEATNAHASVDELQNGQRRNERSTEDASRRSRRRSIARRWW